MNELDLLLLDPAEALEGLRDMAVAQDPQVRQLFNLRRPQLAKALWDTLIRNRSCRRRHCEIGSRNGLLIQAAGIPYKPFTRYRGLKEHICVRWVDVRGCHG